VQLRLAVEGPPRDAALGPRPPLGRVDTDALTAISSPSARPWRKALTTSAVPVHFAMSAGRLSIIPFQIVRASS
jgi:hypothetical protein